MAESEQSWILLEYLLETDWTASPKKSDLIQNRFSCSLNTPLVCSIEVKKMEKHGLFIRISNYAIQVAAERGAHYSQADEEMSHN